MAGDKVLITIKLGGHCLVLKFRGKCILPFFCLIDNWFVADTSVSICFGLNLGCE